MIAAGLRAPGRRSPATLPRADRACENSGDWPGTSSWPVPHGAAPARRRIPPKSLLTTSPPLRVIRKFRVSGLQRSPDEPDGPVRRRRNEAILELSAEVGKGLPGT